MVFSSAPLYLDPHNWHHHQQQDTTANHDVGVDNGGDNNPDHHQISAPMQPPLPSHSIGGSNSSSIKPGSMADRARQAKLPHPEPSLKCPRCQSTNTKFCYFNNYNLAQPRHFCKMCRRYWTKGGALRNVPVGGGFRKNSKKSSNKGGGRAQKAMGEHQDRTSPISSKSNNTDTINNFNNMLDNCTTFAGQSYQPPMTQFSLLASIHGLNHHGQYGSLTSNNLGLNFGGMMSGTAQGELGFHIGSSASSTVNADHQWRRSNNFPNNFLAAFDPSPFSHRPSSSSSPASSLYHFPISQQSLNQQEAMNHNLVKTSSMHLKNFNDEKDNEEAAVVKAEEGMNSFSRSFLGMSDNSHEYLNANNSTTHGQILNRKMGGW